MATNRDDVGIAIRYAFLRRGAQQKFSLIALVILSILLLYIDTFQNRPLDIARSFIKDVIYRGATLVSLPGKGMGFFLTGMHSHFEVRKENHKLIAENIKLKNSIISQNFLIVENSKLKQLLDQEMISVSILKNAKVIFDKNSPFLKSIILNKGTKENIKKGMAVLDGSNFIGRVVEVNFFSSRVLLVTDLNSRIPIIVSPDGYQAILSGTGKEKPILDYLPDNHTVVTGNGVFTSGKDGIFSSGIPIGETLLEDGSVTVSLYSDISQLSYVNVELGDKFTELE